MSPDTVDALEAELQEALNEEETQKKTTTTKDTKKTEKPKTPQSFGPINVLKRADIAVNKLKKSKNNVRQDVSKEDIKSLAQSLQDYGIIHPLLVTKKGEVISGGSRLDALKLAKVKTAPCIVVDIEDDHAFEVSAVENMIRKDLNPIEQGELFQNLRDRGFTVEKIASTFGKTGPNVSKHLKILDLDKATRDKVRKGILSFSAALALTDVPKGERKAVTKSSTSAKDIKKHTNLEMKKTRAVVAIPAPHLPKNTSAKLYADRLEIAFTLDVTKDTKDFDLTKELARKLKGFDKVKFAKTLRVRQADITQD